MDRRRFENETELSLTCEEVAYIYYFKEFEDVIIPLLFSKFAVVARVVAMCCLAGTTWNVDR